MRIKGEGTFGFDESKGLFWWRLRLDGQSVVRKAKTSRALRAKVLKVQNELESTGRLQSKAERSWKAAAWLNEWLEVYVKPSARPATYRFYEQMIRLYVSPILGTKALRDVTQADCQRVVNNALQELGVSQTTAAHARAVMIRALKKAVALDLIRRNPAESTSPIQLSESSRRSLPPERVPEIIAEALRYRELKTRPGEFVLVHRDGPLIAFLLSTGLRIGEALATSPVDLNLGAKPRPTVRVERNLDRSEGWWQIAPTKSRKARRTVPLSEDAVKAIEAQKRLLGADMAAIGEDYRNQGFLFAAATGEPLSERNVQRSLNSILGAIDEREPNPLLKLGHYSLHELRHTFASVLANRGVPIHVLQALMGHENSATTSKYYLHAFADDLASAVMGLDKRNTA